MSLAQRPTTGPLVEPVSLAEAKLHFHVDTTDEDPTHTAMIVAAREYCEGVVGRQFIHATWKEYFDRFPSDEMRLSRLPLSSGATPVTSITYVDVDGATITWTASLYQVDAIGEPAKIKPAYGESWPTARDDTYNAITVTYVAGYGAAASDVPPNFKQAIFLLVGLWHRDREAWVDRRTAEVQAGLRSLLHLNKAYVFGTE